MAEELVRLVVEVDASKVGPASARMRSDFQANVRAMDAESKKAQAGVAAIGQGAQNASRFAATAMRSMSAAIGAATAAAAAQQRSWLALGTTILGTFAAGGPVAGGIALVGAAIGLISSGADEMGNRLAAAGEKARAAFTGLHDAAIEAGRDAERAGRSDLENLAADARLAKERAEFLQGVSGSPTNSLGDIQALRMRIQERAGQLQGRGDFASKAEIKFYDDLEEKLKTLEPLANAVADALEKMRFANRTGMVRSGVGPSLEEDVLAAKRALASAGGVARGSLDSAAEGAAAAARAATDREDLAAVREAIRLRSVGADSLRQAEALQRTFNGEKADEVRLEQEIAELEEQYLSLSRLTSTEGKTQAADVKAIVEGKKTLLGVTRSINASNASRDMANELAMMRAITDEERAQVSLARELDQKRRSGWSEAGLAEFAALKNRQPIVDFARSLTDTVRGSLTDAIVDGLTNGFKNGEDILNTFVTTLQRQLIGSLVGSITSGLPSLLVGLFGGGGGGGGLGGLGGVATTLVGAFTGSNTSTVSGPGFSPLPGLDDP